MAATADAVIIGGGVMGLCVAVGLSEQGVQRVVLLAKRCIGAGSPGKSWALLRLHYSHDTTIRMSRHSLPSHPPRQALTAPWPDVAHIPVGSHDVLAYGSFSVIANADETAGGGEETGGTISLRQRNRVSEFHVVLNFFEVLKERVGN